MDKPESSNSFWKSSSRIVPGRPSLNQYSKSANSTRTFTNKGGDSSFKNYQISVSDAWDTGDDEFCILNSRKGESSSTLNEETSQGLTSPSLKSSVAVEKLLSNSNICTNYDHRYYYLVNENQIEITAKK